MIKGGSNTKNTNQASIGYMIGTFKKIVDNPIAKLLLNKALVYCEEDGASRLEVGLNLHLGKRKEACHKCKVTSGFIGYVVSKGLKSFGVSEEEFRDEMEDQYWVRGLVSVLKGIAIFGVRKPFIPGAPFQVVWNITKTCNMRCIHCYENAGRKGKDELKPDEVIKGLDILAKSGVTSIAFSGGEPTLHPNILQFIRYANHVGMHVAMATNGYILSDRGACKKFAEAGLQFVQISIDGVDPKTHDSFRGVNGAWVKAVEAVKNCVKLGIFVEVATTVTKHNVEEINRMISFVRSLGAQWFMLYNFIPAGKGVKIADMDISPQKRFKLLKRAYTETLKGEMQILSTAPQYATVATLLSSGDSAIIPTHFYNPEYSNPMVMQLAEFIGGCGAGRFYMSIEPNGDMYPCVFFPHEDEVKLGKLLEDDFEGIWKNNKLLGKLRNKNILKGHCGECKSMDICGGCRARAYNYFHDVLAPDPGCIYNENEWRKVNALLSEKAQEICQGSFMLNLRAQEGRKYGCATNKPA